MRERSDTLKHRRLGRAASSVSIRHAPSNRSPIWALAALIWGIGSFFLASFLVGLIASFLPFIKNNPLWVTLLSTLVYIVAIFIAAYIPGRINQSWRSSRHSLGLDGLPTWIDIALAVAGYIIFALLAFALNQLFISLFSWYDPGQAQDVGYDNLYDNFDRLIAFISLVIIAPIAEEILFRGWIYGKVRKYLPLIPTIILVSVAFGFMHGQWNASLTTFALSLILCSGREVTGTIYSGIILHMLNNALAFYALYIT